MKENNIREDAVKYVVPASFRDRLINFWVATENNFPFITHLKLEKNLIKYSCKTHANLCKIIYNPNNKIYFFLFFIIFKRSEYQCVRYFIVN